MGTHLPTQSTNNSWKRLIDTNWKGFWLHPSVIKASGRKVVCLVVRVGGNSGQTAGRGSFPWHTPRPYAASHTQSWAGREWVHYTPLSLSLAWSPTSPQWHKWHETAPTWFAELQGVLWYSQKKLQSFFNSFSKVFSFLLCWWCDCLVYSAILKGLSGSHIGKRFPFDQLCAMQKE